MLALLLACTGEPEDTGLDPTLTNVQDTVFTPACAFSSCHQSPGASDLVLEEGASYGELVGVAAVDAPGETLVVPGDPDGSYLVKKLRPDPGIVGDPMPDGSPDGLDTERLALVEAWIAAGAPED
jgi:hypothetical protein